MNVRVVFPLRKKSNSFRTDNEWNRQTLAAEMTMTWNNNNGEWEENGKNVCERRWHWKNTRKWQQHNETFIGTNELISLEEHRKQWNLIKISLFMCHTKTWQRWMTNMCFASKISIIKKNVFFCCRQKLEQTALSATTVTIIKSKMKVKHLYSHRTKWRSSTMASRGLFCFRLFTACQMATQIMLNFQSCCDAEKRTLFHFDDNWRLSQTARHHHSTEPTHTICCFEEMKMKNSNEVSFIRLSLLPHFFRLFNGFVCIELFTFERPKANDKSRNRIEGRGEKTTTNSCKLCSFFR